MQSTKPLVSCNLSCLANILLACRKVAKIIALIIVSFSDNSYLFTADKTFVP